MSALLRMFWQILLLRSSPQIVPYSQLLLVLVLFAHLLVGVALASFTLPLEEAMLSAALGSLLLVTFSWGLFALFSVAQRTVQAVTALAGCEIFIGLMALPLNAWYFAVPKSDAAVPALLSLLLLGWNLTLVAHIYRHTLAVSKGVGFLISMGYMIVSIVLAAQFGAPEG